MMTYYSTISNVCPLCKKQFTNIGLRKRQNSIHTMHNIKTYKCHLCKKGCYHAGYLRRHIICHTRVNRHKDNICKQYQCTLCHKVFQQEQLIKTHLMTHVFFNAQKTDECYESCTSNERVRQHNKWKKHICSLSDLNDDTLTNQFQCTVCKKGFSSVDNLKTHMLSHVRLYSTMSGKSFAFPDNLNAHTQINSRLKPYMCNVCKKSFTLKYAHKTHMLDHPRAKPFQCVICIKTIAQASHLKQHRLIHSNPKLYRCDICNKTFVRFVNLRKHMSIHSGFVQDNHSSSKICKTRKKHTSPDTFTSSKSKLNQYRVRSIHTDQKKNIKIRITSLKFDKKTYEKNNLSQANLRKITSDKDFNKSIKQCLSKYCLSPDHSHLKNNQGIQENSQSFYSSAKQTHIFDYSDCVVQSRTAESRKLDIRVNTDRLTATTNSMTSHHVLEFIDKNQTNPILKEKYNTLSTIRNKQPVPNSSKSTQTTWIRNCSFFVAKPTISKNIEVPFNLNKFAKTRKFENSQRLDHSCGKQIIPYNANLSGDADKRTNHNGFKLVNPERAKNTTSSSKSAKPTKCFFEQNVDNCSSSTELIDKQSCYSLPIQTRANTYYLRNTKVKKAISQNCASISVSKNGKNGQICKNIQTNKDPEDSTKFAKSTLTKRNENNLYCHASRHKTLNDNYNNNIPMKTREGLCSSDTENPIKINQGGIYSNYIIKLHSTKFQRMEDLVFLVKDVEK